MVMARESEIEKYFVWTVQRMGGTAYKFTSPAHRGVSDRIACLPSGAVWFVELKSPGGRLSPLQKLFAARMKELGQNYTTLWSKTEIDEWQHTITSSTPTQPNGCET
jgi:hypothetical protein